MKVAIYQPFEISPEQLLQLGAVLTGKTKPKVSAKRDEVKKYVWEHGSDWADDLAAEYAEAFPNGAEEDDEDEDEAVDEDDLV